MSRRYHETLAFQRNAGVGEEVFDFRVNDRVMTVDGLPGQVVACNSGPFPGTEDYQVTLDHGMGGGSYTAGQLKKINTTTAALHEAAEFTASIPVEAITTHTADVDYPELGTILQDRLPNENIKLAANQNESNKPQSSQEDPGERMDQQDDETEEPDDDDTNTDTKAAEEPADEAGKDEEDAGPPDLEEEKAKNTPDVTPPSACSFCGADAFEDPQMTGRGVRMRCSQCGGTMKSWGGQWEPEFPNSSQNNASGQSDWSQGGAAGVANAPGANFKTSSLQTESGILNWVVDKIYDRIEERKNHEILGNEWAWHTGLEGMPTNHTDYADYCTPSCHGVHPQSLHPEGMTIHGSLSADYDSEWKFHFTSSWQDVQAKAKRIRKEGGVKITVASNMGVAGEVKGDHNVYETQLNYVLGTKHVADWSCGCKWASYSWGRSPAFKRFEARLCSHALALQYEANARGMFGRDVAPDTERPTWQKAHHPVQVQYERPSDRHPEGRDLRRRAVPPGNMKRTFSSLFHRSDEHYDAGLQDGREYASTLDEPANGITGEALNRLGDYAQTNPEGSGRYIKGFRNGHDEHFGLPPVTRMPLFRSAVLDTDGIYESPELIDLQHAPIFASIQAMASAGEPTENIIEMMASHDVSREAAKAMIFEAFHVDEDGKRRDGDEYETPDGDRFNHGTPHDQDQWSDPEFVRANPRDLSDHDDDKHAEDHKRMNHRTNDAREHAPHWGWGFGADVPLETCGQCAGSGCGHCAGQGQVAIDNSNPAQTDDAGDIVSGISVAGVQHTADYSSADPLAGVDQQTYYAPTNHSNSRNPASTGWATSQDPGDWGRSIITNNFGLTSDAALDSEPTVAGVLLRASDTGRLLMIQRSLTEGDRAAGLWEMPGGHLEDGEPPLHGAVREFEEETGHPFPQDAFVVHTWRSGPYRGHLVEVPSEQHLDFSKGRQIPNPDGDIHEHVAWWDPNHAKKNPALRPEMKGAPWEQFRKAADRKIDLDAGDGGSMFEHRFAEPNQMGTHCQGCARPLHPHEMPDGECEDCLTARDAPDFSGGHAQHVDRETGHKFNDSRFNGDWNPTGYELHRLHTNSTLVNDPDEVGALPFTTGEADGDVFAGQTGGSSGDSSLPQASHDALSGGTGAHTTDSLHQAFLNTPGAQAMMADLGITKSAMKDFSFQEQQDLINEGQGARARNYGDLKIAGTHYEHLGDDEDGDLWV